MKDIDIELSSIPAASRLTWKGVGLTLGSEKTILQGVSGSIEAGQMLAVMGPSGAGKSTFLDCLSGRSNPSSGRIDIDGSEDFSMQDLSSYVEQSDALLGVLTVEETLRFAARLSLPPSTPVTLINKRVSMTIRGLGLSEIRKNRIGTPIQRGISGGQMRRVTIGCSLVTLPKILLLDEPTSGLDSRTSREVMLAIKEIAVMNNILVIATIHQPNWETFSLFDKLLLLANGRMVYSGPTLDIVPYFESLGHPCAEHVNPADHAINIVNTDFMRDATKAAQHIDSLAHAWAATQPRIRERGFKGEGREYDDENLGQRFVVNIGGRNAARPAPSPWRVALKNTLILMERNTLNYSRNLLAYGVRLGMYLGMGILLATVWVNLAQEDIKINDRLSIHFFSVAFLGFMSVAGIPSFLEERHVFVRERLNGLYGPGPYVIANSVISAPFLAICTMVFCLICYWSIGLHPGADHFMSFFGLLFLGVYVAESQSVLVAAAVPIFVAALAIASFINGFWMCVQGYFIRAVNLPKFWYYWAHWIDYQTYAFNTLVNSDFRGLVFACQKLADGSCHCDFPSSLERAGQCALRGEDVLDALDIGWTSIPLNAFYLFLIAVIYRVLMYIVLVLKKR